ncbi:MAG: exodeoxyribonuclease VII large subunit [Bacteroidetes bacterium]|nr:exodeoxyribonuclease VII large subunit [Bacteroidota bacterium]
MFEKLKLSELVEQIQETIIDRFEGEEYWVSAQITNVKKYESNRRCYLTLEDYENREKTAEMRAVFWSNSYGEIEKFENTTKQIFKNGIEIICKVKIRFHKVYGFNLDVLQIDIAHTIGSLELLRQQTIERLLKENPKTIQLYDGVFKTFNNRLPLPLLIKSIALITAPNSDGQRDFLQETLKNKYGYSFEVKEFLTTIQGDNAHKLILEQLKLIEMSKIQFDVIAIVRGGGSQTDFKPFDDYDLCQYVANFPIPIFTGIGHDRNQSIVDLMAREQKTPTKVASLFVECNFEFENKLIELKTNFFDAIAQQIQNAKDDLNHAKRIVKLASPDAILNRGFAIITINNKIVTNPNDIKENTEIQTILRNETIFSTVTKKTKNEERTEL